jgi:2-amino-4-hydroxy-6-hydroxymethyldihydropteridine diphosphokinase
VIKHVVYLSLGSNINREYNIKSCLNKLEQNFGDILCSPIYESEPVGFTGACFYNLVVRIKTTLSLTDLTRLLKVIEDQNGRVRGGERFSSRTLDIDILTYDDLCGVFEGIELPRPEIYFNAFVLLPMVDIAGDKIDPKSTRTYASLWSDNKKTILEHQKLWQVNFA